MKFHIVLILILLPTLLLTNASISVKIPNHREITYHKYNQTYGRLPINFWSADELLFPISQVDIFPFTNMFFDNSLSNLGIAWITWTINVGDKKMPVFAIYNRGHIENLTIINKMYDEITFSSISNNLIIVSSTDTQTELRVYFNNNHISKIFPFSSTKAQVLLNGSDILVFVYRNGTIPTNIIINYNGINYYNTSTILLSAFANSGIFQLSNNSLQLFNGEKFITLPNSFTNKSKIAHYLMSPAVIDISTLQAYFNNDIIYLPNNTVAMYEMGLKSSIVITSDNKMYEYGYSWVLIDTPLVTPLAYSIIDIDLYIGAIPDHGLKLIATGGDDDNDFAPDTLESYYGSLPDNSDSDMDTIPDGVEIAFGTNPTLIDTNADIDKDKLVNVDEINIGSDPRLSDSDFGGAIDGWEVKYGFNPNYRIDDYSDPDNDDVPNYEESIWWSNPFNSDSDGDNIPDSWEIKYNIDPMNPATAFMDNDGDGYSNYYEYIHGTDPLYPDPQPIFLTIAPYAFILFVIGIPIANKVYAHSFINHNSKR